MTGDSLPPRLFKFFTERAHADLFALEGRIRLRIPKYFTETEDRTRADKSEGEARLRIHSESVANISLDTGAATYKPGVLEYAGRDLNPTYIYCMALPEVDLNARLKIWPHLVEVTDPMDFAADLEEGFRRCIPRGHQLAWFEFVRVIYNKDELVSRPSAEERARLSYAQKPLGFMQECECRFVFKLDIVAQPAKDEFIDLQLTRHQRYARVVITAEKDGA